MGQALRLIAIFAVLYIISSVIMAIALPHLMDWQFSACQSQSFTCSALTKILSYWWLALLPLLLIATLLINLATANRQAA